MQPLYTQNLLDLLVWVGSLFIWRGLEVIVDIRTIKHLRTKGVRRKDKGSQIVILFLLVSGILAAVLVAYKVGATSITIAPDFFFWLGIFLMYAGIVLRFYAISLLGTFFTTAVAIAPGQRVIEAGPYRLIRHPSYTGLLMILLGIGLSFTNWLSVAFIMVCAFLSLGYRIVVEERVLQEELGQPYREYMQRTKRLIPFVL
jgi:protein-S-isoprenylcysteine O-methyltransferase Ste14